MTATPGRIVTQERDFYRVDGYLMDTTQIPPDVDVPFELEMLCYDLRSWQKVVHNDASTCEPPIVPPEGWECGDLVCGIPAPTDWVMSEVFNYLGDEFCDDPDVPRETFEPQSTVDYENSGVFYGLC
jgi:hypothetical protein